MRFCTACVESYYTDSYRAVQDYRYCLHPVFGQKCESKAKYGNSQRDRQSCEDRDPDKNLKDDVLCILVAEGVHLELRRRWEVDEHLHSLTCGPYARRRQTRPHQLREITNLAIVFLERYVKSFFLLEQFKILQCCIYDCINVCSAGCDVLVQLFFTDCLLD